MNALLRPFVALCLFRIGPQDLPASTVLLGVALAAHALSGAIVSMLVIGPFNGIAAGITGTAILAALTGSLLVVIRMQQRLVQTLAALAGCDALIGLVAAPVMFFAHNAQGGAAGLAGSLVLALVVWSIAVFGHVLRHALSASMVVGVVVALVFYWISMGVLNHLYAPAGA